MEDLITTKQRLESIKTLGEKKQKTKKKSPVSMADDLGVGASLMGRRVGLDFGSYGNDTKSFYDIDSHLAAKSAESIIDEVFESRHFLDDDGIGVV